MSSVSPMLMINLVEFRSVFWFIGCQALVFLYFSQQNLRTIAIYFPSIASYLSLRLPCFLHLFSHISFLKNIPILWKKIAQLVLIFGCLMMLCFCDCTVNGIQNIPRSSIFLWKMNYKHLKSKWLSFLCDSTQILW